MQHKEVENKRLTVPCLILNLEYSIVETENLSSNKGHDNNTDYSIQKNKESTNLFSNNIGIKFEYRDSK